MSRPLDLDAVRAEFAILSRDVNGKPLVYFDNAASAQKPDAVLDAISDQARTAYANVHRGLHTLANETTEAYEGAREKVRAFINAGSVDEIIFTKGGTEAINLVANGIAHEIQPGDEIVLSIMEHHSNIVPWHFLRERYGAVLKWVDVDETGALDMDALQAVLSEKTRMVAVTHMSNVLGTVTDAAEITRMAHAHQRVFLAMDQHHGWLIVYDQVYWLSGLKGLSCFNVTKTCDGAVRIERKKIVRARKANNTRDIRRGKRMGTQPLAIQGR
ncbi:MAG: aminotransferase class V-fold PLP-dependent enzyme, partial [Pseudomonadota bacterium]